MKKLTKLDISILLCNVIENFDVILYAFLAPVLGRVLFGFDDPINQLLGAYGAIGVSVFSKPLGAYFFTKLAVKKDPFFSLKLSVWGMSMANLMLFFMPTYAEIGWLAPALLLVSRCIIGLFSAGETAVARTLLIEREASYRMSSHYESSTMVGIIMASFISTLIIKSCDDTSWRLAFLLSAFLGVFSYFLRYSSNEKLEMIQSDKKYIISKVKVLKIVFNRLVGNMTYYIPFVVMNTLMPIVNSNVTIEIMMEYNSILLMFDMSIFVLVAYFKIQISPKKVIFVSYSILALFVPFMFLFFPSADLIIITFTRCIIVVFGVLAVIAQNIFFNKMFENPSERYFVVGNTIAMTDAIVGETTPAICMLIFNFTHSITSVGLYFALCCLICVYLNTLE